MITAVTVITLFGVGMVTGDGKCQPNSGAIKNCCSLGYNNNNYNVMKSGIYAITNFCGVKCSNTHVYCDTTSGGGGWTVLHRRQDGSINFTDRDWVEYEDGFGYYSGEFWIGLRSMHCLTSQGNWELRIDYTLKNGTRSYLHYKKFAVGPPTDQYRLTISGFDTVGLSDPFDSYNGRLNGKVFSSRDRENDDHPRVNCGQIDGGWWHSACTGIEPNDHYGDLNIYLNREWLIYTFMEIKARLLNCTL